MVHSKLGIYEWKPHGMCPKGFLAPAGCNRVVVKDAVTSPYGQCSQALDNCQLLHACIVKLGLISGASVKQLQEGCCFSSPKSSPPHVVPRMKCRLAVDRESSIKLNNRVFSLVFFLVARFWIGWIELHSITAAMLELCMLR